MGGTVEAREAVLETHIPQTSVIVRKDAKLIVAYDGKPKFVEIEDTKLKYAVNTSYAVIEIKTGLIKKAYYCCHEGVWYEAKDPLGPWTICVKVPKDVYAIPPSCPVYYVKYVYVYSATPEVVYVGYTPGYTGCYVHHGVVVYGTGHVHHGWYGRVYYPPPRTFGLQVRSNPNTGNWAVRGGVRRPYGFAGFRYADIDLDIDRSIDVK